MHLPPGIEWSHEDVTMLYWSRDNVTNNSTNGSDFAALNLTGATIASPIIMFLSGLIGNLLALVVLHRTRMESQRMMFHSLVAGLVWNDLTGIVLTSPVTIASYINGLQMPGGDHLCKFNGFIMICFGLSTPLIVSAMAIERFLFVKYTFFYTKHCAPGVARLLIIAIWGFVLFFGLLPMFGFGNYVLQYPRTWCFLDFRTSNPVHATYGYLYSSLNLLLVVIMVMCNLVVVLTLARVRGYRRKHSNTSGNSVIIADGMMDDSQKQQAVRRRKQKDIELQMIVVMCAITTIFAVCWAPLMIHITLTLATGGKTLDVLGLVAVRLASLNQTLNPWLYVILRRALIVRIKKYCCSWRHFLKTKPHFSPPPVGRRHQYVHVRNQLCHKNNFVGAEVKDDLLSESMRKSLQQAIPAAMSLPDVMMVNTGRRDLDIPMPDVAKAESFAGRVSHSCSIDSILTCAYCNAPVVMECIECFREKYMTTRALDIRKDPSLHGETSIYDNKSVVCDTYHHIKDDNDTAKEKIESNHLKPNENENQDGSKMPSGGSTPENFGVKKERVCSKHSSNSKHSSDGQRDTPSSPPGSDHLKNKTENDMAASSSPTPVYFLQSRDHSHRMSQHMHTPRSLSKSSSVKSTPSKSSSVKTTRSRIYPVSQKSPSEDAHMFKPPSTRRHIVRHESGNSDTSRENDAKELFLDGSRDSDDVFDDGTCIPCMRTSNEITANNDPAFSNVPTESFWLSESSTIHKHNQASPDATLRNNRNINIGKCLDPIENELDIHDSPQHDVIDIKNDLEVRIPDTSPIHPQLNLTSHLSTDEPFEVIMQNPACENQPRCVSNSSVCPLEEEHCEPQYDSSVESERSSGVFSAESPVPTYRGHESQPKWQLQKESQSEPLQAVRFAKQVSRRVHSCN